MNTKGDIKTDDFYFVWQGKVKATLNADQCDLLAPIDKDSGDKKSALLMLHGFASTPAQFRALAPKIVGYDKIVCPALPGHGSSMAAFEVSTFQEWLDCARSHCADLIGQYQRVDVLGLSLGGLLAYQLSREYSIDHLYLLAPAFKLTYPERAMVVLCRLCHKLGIRWIKNCSGNIHDSRYAELTYKKLPVHAIIQIFLGIKKMKPEPLSCPTEVWLGRWDKVVDSKKISNLLSKDPKATIRWLEHSSHILSLDGDLDELVEVINHQQV